MGQHDYDIANQTFPNTRTDWNNLNTAILTNNSGASAPSTTAAFMFWADTTNSLFKMRNSGDSGWVTLFGTDGKILAVDGSASLPSLSFSGDTNTGLFRPTTDVIGFSNSGSESARFDASGYLGLGQVSPSYQLDILGTESASSTSATLNIAHTTNPRIRFRGTTSNIRGYFGLDDTTQNFQWADDSGNVRMYLKQNGNLGLGVVPSSKLDVIGEAQVSNSTYGVKLTYSVGNTSGIVDTYGNHGLELRANNNSIMYLTASSLVGIGTTSPSDGKLQVSNSTQSSATIRKNSIYELTYDHRRDTSETFDDYTPIPNTRTWVKVRYFIDQGSSTWRYVEGRLYIRDNALGQSFTKDIDDTGGSPTDLTVAFSSGDITFTKDSTPASTLWWVQVDEIDTTVDGM